MTLWFEIIILVLALSGTESLDNGLALTPPMGWMQWERFRCNINCTDDPDNCISERLFKTMADIMVSDGYRDAGYKYVAIDDCWMTSERGPDGKLQPDPVRFPNGMKHLADYIHSKGLKLGIYGDMGTLTCKKYPGSKFYLELDAQTFASWEVDMLKLDCCYAGSLVDVQTGFPAMSQYLNNTGRPILYACCWAACEGLYYKHKPDYKAIAKHCNMWRNYNDLQDAWKYVYAAIDFYGNNTAHFQEVVGPGAWNDPDELIVGDFGLSYDQERVQFGMWCMMASPLFMSVDLRNIRQTSNDLLLNKNLLRIHSDELLVQAYRISKDNLFEVWLRPLRSQYFSDGSYAVAVLRHDDYGMPFPFNTTLQSLGMKNKAGYKVTEAFDGKEMGKLLPQDQLRFPVNPTGIFLVTLTPIS
ncbi:alpha-N-acetylgalactosaminidase-like isoform X1 [Ruditapes philippinarum]|uniref:alpha-N-acetylgalactosaminidase-like isoform X1 n=1 Tax=Ruditapes philippinarum TaxID=129788 RepID=UPI00295B1AA2|nr:alpha-N-acetylgalactosaminidase-like isoform X1 [Ruditapes philippinarum]